MSLEDDYKRDYAKFSGSLEEYKEMVRNRRLVRFLLVVILLAIVGLFVWLHWPLTTFAT